MIYFCKLPENIVGFAKLTNTVLENSMSKVDYALEKYGYQLPSFSKIEDNDYRGDDWFNMMDADAIWLSRALGVRFTVWQEYGLLGIEGNFVEAEDIPCKSLKVEFQDWTDTDYDFEYWGTDFPIFDEMVEKAKSIPLQDIPNYYPDEIWDGYENYYRRTYAYNLIYKALDINSYIDGKLVSPKYYQFDLSNRHGEYRVQLTWKIQKFYADLSKKKKGE